MIKKVDNVQVAGWTVNASGPSSPMTVTPASQVTTASGTVDFRSSKVATAGSSLTLAEVAQAGYTNGSVACTGPSTTQNGAAGLVSVTVKPSETWTCTFNNTTNTGTIKVIKKVDNVQVAGWTVNATNPAGPATITPGSVVTHAATTMDSALSKVVAAGSSTTLTEVGQAGYTNGAVTCTGPSADQSGTAGSVSVTVKPGETSTCTFTNTTNVGVIKVIKKVDNVQVAGATVNASNPALPTTITPAGVVTITPGTADFG